jgi:CheY-like chemotaxis protein
MDWKQCFIGKKVLVAEDDLVNQELMQDIFSSMGISIEIAKDGNEAVEKVKNGAFDLVLMDIRMPNKDGIQASKEIRSLENGKQIPIFALTASVLPSDKEEIILCGVTDFLSKPIDLNELREKMAKVLLGA